MTKNGDFGQNRHNWLTSNACRIGEHINDSGAYRLKHKCIIGEQMKLPMGAFKL
jgi:hypothetical protein